MANRKPIASISRGRNREEEKKRREGQGPGVMAFHVRFLGAAAQSARPWARHEAALLHTI